MKISTQKRNGKKGGRPKSNTYNTTFKVPGFGKIILTEKQYYLLIERYGDSLLEQALSILESWLSTSYAGDKYLGKNNYAHFRSDGWLINEARHISKQQI